MNEKILKIAESIDKNLLSEPADVEIINNLPVSRGGLTFIYGLSGAGKSYQTSALLKGIENVVYINTEAGNGKTFKAFVENNNQTYINGVGSNYNNLKDFIVKSSQYVDIFVIDSFSSFFNFENINNSEFFTESLYKLASFAEIHNVAIVIIDHATKKYDKNNNKFFIKIEGNETGKFKVSNFVLKYEPIDYKNPKLGGEFIVEKSRATDTIQIGSKININNENVYELIKNEIKYKMKKKKITIKKLKTMTKTEIYNIFIHKSKYNKDDIYKTIDELLKESMRLAQKYKKLRKN